jgi:methionyl-tRNA synthetase
MNKNPSNYKVIFVSLPYVTADLHLGRIAGSFLPADIMKRFEKKFCGTRCYLVSGLDCYGTSIVLESHLSKKPIKQILKQKSKEIFNTLKIMNIALFQKFKTTSKAHSEFVNTKINELHQRNRLFSELHKVPKCELCDIYLSDRFLVDSNGNLFEKLIEAQPDVEVPLDSLSCFFCKNKVMLESKNGLFLRYDWQNELYQDWLKKYNVKESSKQITRHYTKWGVKADPKINRVINSSCTYYVWIEALYSYLEQYQKIKNKTGVPGTEFFYFFGKDNDYYHRIILPQLISESEISPLNSNVKLINRAYIKSTDNKKMSSSEKNYLLVNELNEDPDTLRFCLAYSDPFNNDQLVNKTTIADNSRLYRNKYLNLVRRTIGLFKKYKPTKEKVKTTLDLEPYLRAMKMSDLKHSIDKILELAKVESKKIDQKIKLNSKFSNYQLCTLYEHVRLIIKMMYPFTPKMCTENLAQLKKLAKTFY